MSQADGPLGAAAWLTIAVQLGPVWGAGFQPPEPLRRSLAEARDPGRFVRAAAANAPLVVAGGAAVSIPLRFATGFFLAGVYPPAFKLIAT